MPRQQRKVPWLHRRENGVYYAAWYDAAARRTRQCSLHTDDSETASAAFAQFLLNGKTIYKQDEPDGATVEDVLDKYLREHAGARCADWKRQETAAKHLSAFFGDTLLADVDLEKSRDYADARRGGVIGGGRKRRTPEARAGTDTTIRRELGVLLAAANHARRRRRINDAGMPTVELPLATTTETQFLTKEEVVRLFDAADDYLLRFCRIAYFTAGRRDSVERLSLDQLDFEHGRINLAKRSEVRTVKRRPIVPLYDDIKPDLRWLVTRAEGTSLFAGKDFYRPFTTLCAQLGFPEGKRHPHILRHSRATHLLQRGTSIYDVAKLLGDTVATVERTYGHHSSEFLSATTGGM